MFIVKNVKIVLSFAKIFSVKSWHSNSRLATPRLNIQYESDQRTFLMSIDLQDNHHGRAMSIILSNNSPLYYYVRLFTIGIQSSYVW